MRASDRVRVVNDGGRPLTLLLAPQARERLLAPGESVVVEAEGPVGSHAELLVERTCDTVTVWGWPGADLRLRPDDRPAPVGPTLPPPAPVAKP